MDEDIIEMHKKSGLLQAVKQSKISIKEAQDQVLKFLKEDCKLKNG